MRLRTDSAHVRFASACTLLALLAGLTACAGQRRATAAGADETVITLDGDVRDWPARVVGVADEHHLYLRFRLDDDLRAQGVHALQAAPYTTTILLDIDDDARTGYPELLPGWGVDMAIELSPPKEDGTLGVGARAYALSPSGGRTSVDLYDWDFSFAPTHAPEGEGWVEARISRTPAGPLPVPTSGLLSTGRARAIVSIAEPGARSTAWTDPINIDLGTMCMSGPRLTRFETPAKAPGAVRVVVHNVLRSRPEQEPAPFVRLYGALNADVVLVQEWEVASESELAEWFQQNLGGGVWSAAALPGEVRTGQGVGVVSRFPVERITQQVSIPGIPATNNEPRSTRFVAARISTPWGDLIAGSVHLKARGGANSPEDQQRIAEAEAINEVFAQASGDTAMRIIAGDFNLVGTRPPLDVLRRGLDSDGSDLDVVDAMIWGDRLLATWGEAGNSFTLGRLDYAVISGASLRVAQSFVLDTSRIGTEALARQGLLAGDTADASDHYPIVIDLVPR